jgi:hypothetical protein
VDFGLPARVVPATDGNTGLVRVKSPGRGPGLPDDVHRHEDPDTSPQGARRHADPSGSRHEWRGSSGKALDIERPSGRPTPRRQEVIPGGYRTP